MKVWNKVLVVLLAVAMMIPAVAATAEEEMPHISLWVTLDSSMTDEDAPVVQAIREQSGIYLEPIFVSQNEATSKFSARIASGDLPDVFVANSVTAQDLITYGAVIDFSSYLEEYGQNILADGTERLQFGINKNGAVYGVPGQRSYPWAMAVRRDWMKNLGYEVADDANVIEMTNSAFKELMYKFAKEDPDQNGKDDTFGFCAEDSSFGMFAPFFTAYGIPANSWGSMYYDAETDSCKSILKHPEFVNVLKDMNYYYQNACMDTEFAVVADASTEFAYLWNSTCGAAAWSPAGMTNNWVKRYTEEGVDENSFVYVNITNDEGNYGGYISSYNGNYVMIAASCENPEAAVKLIDYFYSREGEITAYLGVEGVHYEWTDKENEKFQYIGKYAEDISNQRTDGGWVMWQMIHGEHHFELRSLTQITVDVIEYASAHQAEGAIVLYETPAIASELGSTLTDVIMGVFAKATIADNADDIDAMVEAAIAEYDSIGGTIYEEQYTELYKASL